MTGKVALLAWAAFGAALVMSTAALMLSARTRRRMALLAAKAGAPCGGPFACQFPKAEGRPGERWRCPSCSTLYRLTRPVPPAWWRNWAAERGHWVIARDQR